MEEITPHRYFLIVLIFLKYFGPSLTMRDFYIRIDTCDVTPSLNYCLANCSIHKNNQSNRVNFYLNVLEQGLAYGVSLNLSGRYPNKPYKHIFYDKVMDMCPYLHGQRRDNLLMILFKEIFRHGKLPNCPVEKDIYHLEDYYFQPNILPPYVPHGFFLVNAKLYLTTMDRRTVELINLIVLGKTVSLRNIFALKPTKKPLQ